MKVKLLKMQSFRGIGDFTLECHCVECDQLAPMQAIALIQLKYP
ncbi:hypothetical protein [Nostoc sp.]